MSPLSFPFQSDSLFILGEFTNLANNKEVVYPFLIVKKGRPTYDGLYHQYLMEPGMAIKKKDSPMAYCELCAIPNKNDHDFWGCIETCFLFLGEDWHKNVLRACLSKEIFLNNRKSISDGDEFYTCISLKQDMAESYMALLSRTLESLEQSRKSLYFPAIDRIVFGLHEYNNAQRGRIRQRLQEFKEQQPICESGSDKKASRGLAKGNRRKTLSLKTRRIILERDKYRCVDCGRSPQNDPSCVLHIDHRIPISKGGSNNEDNLQTLCDWCNLGKGVDMDWKLGQAC
jgi:hypothetical protein